MSKANTPWVIAGGAPGEFAHCQRCGEGLKLEMPIRIEIYTAAANAFTKIHKRCKEMRYKEPIPQTLFDWVYSRDVGTSSLTIWSVITGRPSPHRRYDIPYDPSDFGRCYRLIKLFPEIEERLSEVGKRYPAWIPFVENWKSLKELYERELPSGACPLLFEKIQTLSSNTTTEKT